MAPHGFGHPPRGEGRPRLEVADIFRAHGEVYRQTHVVSPEQRAAMHAIEVCRTEALGGHVDVCNTCAFARPAYNSCRNRHCPKCQALSQAAWIDQRMEYVLPTHYFHVVFTLPHELVSLSLRNRKPIFSLLFAAAAHTLLELGQDEERLGAQLGVTAVLHTWTRDLRFHPHVHCIVTGGGLAPEGDRWISGRRPCPKPIESTNSRRIALPRSAYGHGYLPEGIGIDGLLGLCLNKPPNLHHTRGTDASRCRAS